MKTMIWKELRENAKWAALALICLLIAEIFALASGREGIANNGARLTLCSDTFLLVSAFGCAGIGAALGALQILPELRRDQWASLLHRPVARHVIFLGKAISGLALYLLATGIPLLVSIAYVAWPGQFAAPFVPGLALPAASDLGLGIVFYFEALLLSMHSGRWLGARGAIVLAAVAVLLLHLAGKWPFLLPSGASAILLCAAWGAIHGSVRMRPMASRLALGVVILIGTGTGLLLLGAVLRWIPAAPQVFYSFSNFSIANDGSVFMAKRAGPNGSTLVDMEGNVVTDERYLGNQAQDAFLSPESLVNREIPKARFPIYRTSRSAWQYLELIQGSYQGPEIWYRIPGPHGYFIGYDKLSARCIGICDADGFKGPQATPHSFATEPDGEALQSPPFLYRIGPQLFALDFTERRFTPFLTVGSETVYGAAKFPAYADRQRIAVALASKIRILEVDGRPLFNVPYGHDPEVWPNILISTTQDFSRTFLEYLPGLYFTPKDPNLATHLDVIDAQGQRAASYTTPPYQIPAKKPTWADRLAGLAGMPVLAMIASSVDSDYPTPVYDRSLLTIPQDATRGELLALVGFAAVLGVVAGIWARRDGLSLGQTGTWIALTIAFGVAGFLAYRFSNDWPARVRCPRCGRKRSVTTAACPHCHEAWVAIPANGSEIFEPA